MPIKMMKTARTDAFLRGRHDPTFLTQEDEDEEMEEDESGARIEEGEEGLSNWVLLWMAEC